MPQAPIPFLQFIHDEAGKNSYLSVDLPQQQGIVVLPLECSIYKQIDILQQFITSLKSTELIAPMANDSPILLDTDCQVTVEERTQLFKFLQS